MSALPVETICATLPYWGRGRDGHVEALGFVVAKQLRCVKAAMLGLRIPIELKANGSEAVLGGGLVAAATARARAERDCGTCNGSE